MANYNSKHTGSQIDDAIARALPGGAIDLEKAPAGYGLGENSTYDNLISDCNQATKNGWYWTYENVQNAPMDYGFLHVCCNGSYIKQEWWVAGTMGVLMAIRVCNNGTWMPWEWVNPLMQLGVEYRTTERYLGKPVYKRLIDFGTLPNSGAKEVSVPNANNMHNISIDLSKSVCTKTGYLDTNLFPYHPSISGFYFNIGAVRIETTADYTSWSAKICISYTKSTD